MSAALRKSVITCAVLELVSLPMCAPLDIGIERCASARRREHASRSLLGRDRVVLVHHASTGDGHHALALGMEPLGRGPATAVEGVLCLENLLVVHVDDHEVCVSADRDRALARV